MPNGFLNARRTLNIAHRGASAVAPENTLAAFERAKALGADGIEFDVRLCSDGVPVVIHDATVDGTTNGSGRVADMTLTRLKELDAGSWFSPAFSEEPIPTLTETLETVGGKLLLTIELKGEGLVNWGLARAVVDVIKQHGSGKGVLLSAFNPLILRGVQKIAPDIPTALLYTSASLPRFASLVARRSYAALHPHVAIVDRGHMTWARRQNYRIHVWTVDDPGEMRRLIRWGVDGIVTNVPDQLCRLLGSKT
jgi:glycerophosphoryl diester phosphodiesterase